MPRKVRPGSAFGERLAKLRAERGVTQGQLAEKIGSSQRAISAYETVAEYPPTVAVVEIAQALKVSADELLGLKPQPKAARLPEDPEVRRLWEKFQRPLATREGPKSRHSAHQLARGGEELEERQGVGLIHDAQARIAYAKSG